MEIGILPSTRQTILSLVIPLLLLSWSCSDAPAAHLTGPTSTATQQSTLAPVLSAQITPSIATMRVGETLTFSTQLEFGEGVPPSAKLPLWSSTDGTVIAIDRAGNATAVGAGHATIEVDTHGYKVTRAILVTP